ncbi:MAG: hypothetical protein WBH90_14695 [Aggregatilineales bacterium]
MPRLPHRGAGLLALLLIAAIFGAAPAHAQDDVTLATLRVQIWPEYDQPSALVIVDGRTTENVATPIDLRIPLPPGVTLHAVAYPDSATGNLLNAQYEASEDGVTLTSPNGQFLLEYYDGSLAFDGNTRRYTLAFEVPYDVEQFVWEVQQPAGASGLTLDTGATVQRTTGAMGLLVQRVVVGAARRERRLPYPSRTPSPTGRSRSTGLTRAVMFRRPRSRAAGSPQCSWWRCLRAGWPWSARASTGTWSRRAARSGADPAAGRARRQAGRKTPHPEGGDSARVAVRPLAPAISSAGTAVSGCSSLAN